MARPGAGERRGPGVAQGDFQEASAALASGEALEKALERIFSILRGSPGSC
jgi:hypothetical protein